MEVWAKGTGVDVAYSTDEGLTWTEIGSLTLNSEYPADNAPLNLYFDVVSSRIRFRFRHNDSTGSFILKQYYIYYNEREVRGI